MYTWLDRIIANTLSHTPETYNRLREAYRLARFRITRQNALPKANICLDVADKHAGSTFFGYYDHAPDNGNGHVLLYNTSANTSYKPDPAKPIELVVIDSNSDTVMTIPTRAYNWQQGARAQWLNNNIFCMNDFSINNNVYCTRMFSVEEKKQINVFNHAVQDAFKTQYFLSLNYRRLLNFRPDYGYRNLAPLSATEISSKRDDGIWHTDIESGLSHLLISIEDVVSIAGANRSINDNRWVNHVMISPDGEHYLFVLREILNGERKDRLLVGNVRSGACRLLSDFGMVSHYCWIDSSRYVAYMANAQGEQRYWLRDINTSDFVPIGNGGLNAFGDGHPHVHGNFFVTDTYPDRYGRQYLLLVDLTTGHHNILLMLLHSPRFKNECRCDLHPRISRDGTGVYFDTINSGVRRLCYKPINWTLQGAYSQPNN